MSLNLQTSTFKKPTRIGERIPCTLRIKSSLKWGSKAEQGFFRDLFNVSEDEEDETGEQTNDRSQAMLYEMRFNPHDWAIIGKTSSTFKISSIEGTQLEHPIELVPLRQGSLFVPSIVVLPIVAGHGQGRQGYTKELPDKLPSSETYQDDIAMCVEVVQDSSVAPSMAYDLHTSQIPHTAINAR